MSSTINVNPILTTNAAGSFSVQSEGLIQGMVMDDPAIRYSQKSGEVALTETLPMFGGVAISETYPSSAYNMFGMNLGRALGPAVLGGFTVFNQSSNGLTSPQSPAPSFLNGMSIGYYAMGTKARIAVQCSPALVALESAVVGSVPLAWDFTNQLLILWSTIAATVATTALSWTAGVVTATTASAHGLAQGAFVVLTSAVPAGYNGLVQVTSVPTTTTFTYALATNPGTATTQASVTAATTAQSALPVTVRGMELTNSKVVVYNATTGYATWNVNGAAAIIEI